MRAGETQGEALHGEVQEASGRLAEIRDAVYRGTASRRTETELMSYQVRVRPWKRGPDATARTFILHDCSGQAAENLIRHPSSLRDPDIRALPSLARSSMPTPSSCSSTRLQTTRNSTRRSRSSIPSSRLLRRGRPAPARSAAFRSCWC